MSLRVTVLGSGTSHGVPMIGCDCAVCTSTDPRDRRLRPSILLALRQTTHSAVPLVQDVERILVDTSSDLRAQALAHNLRRVDAILFTHSHADHILGLDEVRRFNKVKQGAIPCYGDERTLADLKRSFFYIFEKTTPRGGGIPQVTLGRILGPFTLAGLEFTPVPVLHGKRLILGYRVGSFAYLTDCSEIPETSWPLLEGVQTLVLDALRDRPHSTHFSLEEALRASERIGARRTYFTHISHELPHAATCARLPDGVELAYDGLEFDVD